MTEAKVCFISGICGFSLRRSAQTVASTLPTVYPFVAISCTVNVQTKIQALHVAAQLLQKHESPDSRRTVKILGELPRQTSSTKTAPQVARCEVNTHNHRIIIAVGKMRGDALAQPADVVLRPLSHTANPSRNRAKRKACRPSAKPNRLQEDDRILVHCCISQLLVVPGIVHSYRYDFHILILIV